MQLIEDPLLVAPASVKPIYEENSPYYTFEVPLENKHPHAIRFCLASTFGCCLTETTQIRTVEPNSSVLLKFKVKLTNLMGGAQKLAIFATHYHFALFPLNPGPNKVIELLFSQDSKVEPAIMALLQEEVDNCISAANHFKSQGDKVKALNKYEQAYQIIRSSQQVMKEMIETRLQLKDYSGAMRDIESYLLQHPNDNHYNLLKVKTSILWFQQEISQNDELYHYLESTLKRLKANHHFFTEDDQLLLDQLNSEFKQYAKVTTGQPDKLITKLYQKAIEKYNSQTPIAIFFNKTQLQKELKQVLLEPPKHEDNATPEEVIDPIGYEILRKPFILPSGNSYEETSLISYFKTNGYKDPISRQGINQLLIFPNLALENYIRQHPKLKEWERYEYDFIYN